MEGLCAIPTPPLSSVKGALAAKCLMHTRTDIKTEVTLRLLSYDMTRDQLTT